MRRLGQGQTEEFLQRTGHRMPQEHGAGGTAWAYSEKGLCTSSGETEAG